jgi:hypothetical protein
MTCTSDSVYYLLCCPGCGAEGSAEWWTTAGGSYQHRSAWGLNVSYDFTQVSGPDDDRLICQACGVDADITEVGYLEFYSIERPAMRPIAGGSDTNLRRKEAI